MTCIQLRGQYAFCMLTKLDNDLKLQWKSFEDNYWKDAVDGVGGTVKHAVYHYVVSECVVIKNSKQFAKYAGTKTQNIRVICHENIPKPKQKYIYSCQGFKTAKWEDE